MTTSTTSKTSTTITPAPSENWDEDFDFHHDTHDAPRLHDRPRPARPQTAPSRASTSADAPHPPSPLSKRASGLSQHQLRAWADPPEAGPSTPPSRRASITASASARVPAENWDDDFEDKAEPPVPPRRHSQVPTSVPAPPLPPVPAFPAPPRAPPGSRIRTRSRSRSATHAQTPSHPSTPSRRASGTHTHPLTDADANAPPTPARAKGKAKAAVPAPAADVENWDVEFGIGAGAGSPQRVTSDAPWSSDDDDDGGELGRATDGEHEEDRTVTARSRRVPIPVRRETPPPVPPLPGASASAAASTSSLHAGGAAFPTAVSASASTSTGTDHPGPPPFPRSPTVSVFSMPASSSAGHTGGTYGYGSTSRLALRRTLSGSSSALHMLPPTPPLARDRHGKDKEREPERERRRLRKKSRPVPVMPDAFELRSMDEEPAPAAPGPPAAVLRKKSRPPKERDRDRYSAVDPGAQTDDDHERAGPSDIPTTPERAKSPTLSSHFRTPVSASASSPPAGASTGRTPLLSRLGSMKRWGTRKKRASTAPSEMRPDPDAVPTVSGLETTPRASAPARSRGQGSPASSTGGGTGAGTGGKAWFFRTGGVGGGGAGSALRGEEEAEEQAEARRVAEGCRDGEDGELRRERSMDRLRALIPGSPTRAVAAASRAKGKEREREKMTMTTKMAEVEREREEHHPMPETPSRRAALNRLGLPRRPSATPLAHAHTARTPTQAQARHGSYAGSTSAASVSASVSTSARSVSASSRSLSRSRGMVSASEEDVSRVRARRTSTDKGRARGTPGKLADKTTDKDTGRRPSVDAGEGSTGTNLMGRMRKLSMAGRRTHRASKSLASGDWPLPAMPGADAPPPTTPPRKVAQLPPQLPQLAPIEIELQPPSPPRTVTGRETVLGMFAGQGGAPEGAPEGAPAVDGQFRSSIEALRAPPLFGDAAAGSASGGGGMKVPVSPQTASLGRSTQVQVPSPRESPVPRRNSLGDLKIPARISQAQVGLRRDLGMVREFAAGIEKLKELQATYIALVGEVQGILSNPPPPSRATSPTFSFSVVRPPSRSRSRSNTAPSPSQTHQQLASAFYSIDSKYRITWECADLLVELAGGASGAQAGPPTSVSAPAMAKTGSMDSRKSRERAITLAGDQSQTPVFAAVTAVAAVATPVNPAWRASTGRNDLSRRQLLLLREMLHNPDSLAPQSTTPPVAEELEHERVASPVLGHTHVNRGWRWGDAASSTVTLPSEESAALGLAYGAAAHPSPLKKRQSKGLGMRGLRDMLKSLKKSQTERMHTVVAASMSTTSLGAESAHQYTHPRIPGTRRRSKTSVGPESVRSSKEGQPPASAGYAGASFAHRPSPRRPSLASIFRLGQRSRSAASTAAAAAAAAKVTEGDPAPRSTSASGSSRRSSGTEDEDWDRMDSGSDLDLAAEALAKLAGGSGSGLALGNGTVKVDSKGKKRSPYLISPRSSQEQQVNTVRKGSGAAAAASQSSIWGDAASSVHTYSSGSHTRTTPRLSNVEEQDEVRRSKSTYHGGEPARPALQRSQSRASRHAGSQPASVRSAHPHAVVARSQSEPQHLPDPKLAMTPENIKPLLENSREVHARLHDCIEEVRALLASRAVP